MFKEARNLLDTTVSLSGRCLTRHFLELKGPAIADRAPLSRWRELPGAYCA